MLLFLLLTASFAAAATAAAVVACADGADEVNPLLGSGSVSVQADVYYGDAGEERVPIARAKFYLLDRNLVQILKRADFTPEDENGGKLKTDAAYLEAAAGAQFNFASDENNALVGLLIAGLLEKHRVASVVTTDDGAAITRRIESGDYYLYGAALVGEKGIGEAAGEIIVWQVPVRVRAGAKTVVTLDQDNAESVFAR